MKSRTRPFAERLRGFFWALPIDQEVDDEIGAHIELQTARFIADGMSEADAGRAALERFGPVTPVREECRVIRQRMDDDVRRAEFLDELRQDTRFALRTLRHNYMFTIIAILTMAIGVGASTAMFSIVDAVVIQSLPYRFAERVVVLWNSYDQVGLAHSAVAAPEYFDYREQIQSLDAVAAFRPSSTTIIGNGADPEQIAGYIVTPNLFSLLGAVPMLGHDFAPDAGRPGGATVVMLSHSLWMRRFGGDSSIIGKSVTIGGLPRTVVGVMGPDIRFPDAAIGFASSGSEVWVPNTMESSRTGSRGNQNLAVIGRLRPSASMATLSRDLDGVMHRFKTDYADRYASVDAKNWSVVAVPLRDEMVGAVRPVLYMLSGAVALVLLIACVNVSSLMLARASLRRGEMAVRLALGAGRPRLLRQLLTESTVLSLAGGLLGVFIAWVSLRTLAVFHPANIPRLGDAHINGTVLAFSLGVSVFTGIAVGLVPAIQQSRTNLRSAMGDGARGTSDGKARRRLRTTLVVAEVALALVILNGAALFWRSFAALQRVDIGFHRHGVASMYLTLPTRIYDSSYKTTRFFQRFQTEAAAIPGVTEVSAVYPLPMAGEPWSGSFNVEGIPPETQESPHAEYAVVLPGYFHVLGISLVQGRDFAATDDAAAPLVVIVDETLAKRYWPKESAIGKRINAGSPSGTWATVIGVVKHVHTIGPEHDSEPQLYNPLAQYSMPMMFPVARVAVTPSSMDAAFRGAVHAIDRDLAVSRMRSMDDVVSSAVARQRFNLFMIAVFAVVALVLASVGLYGVMSYLVAQRTREIGIRIALGGQPADVRLVVVRESAFIALGGLAVGTVATLILSGTIRTLLYGTTGTDPATYAVVALVLMAVTVAAAYVPARRATRIDPVLALRD